jgi:hypothetical protein
MQKSMMVMGNESDVESSLAPDIKKPASIVRQSKTKDAVTNATENSHDTSFALFWEVDDVVLSEKNMKEFVKQKDDNDEASINL